MLDRRLISPEDLGLFKITSSVDEAIAEIRLFYRRFHSTRYVGRQLAMRLQSSISAEQVAAIHAQFDDMLLEGTFELRGALPSGAVRSRKMPSATWTRDSAFGFCFASAFLSVIRPPA